MRGPDHRTSYNQLPCQHCGNLSSQHEREKTFPDDGPAGSYHYKMWCPDDSGRRYSA